MIEADLTAALSGLRRDLGDVRLPLPVAQVDTASADVVAVVNQLDDYVLPRLRDLDAPLVAVVGGSTGSGKSTLVNALVGQSITTAGVLRPTTRYPVLVHHGADGRWFDDDRILPRLPRITGEVIEPVGADERYGVRLVASDRIPRGFGILDAPDLDSVSAANRDLAQLLLAAADLWLFVTTAGRYADAVPWQALRAAQQRDAAVVIVVNRVPPEAVAPITAHVQALLDAEGLADAPLFVVPEVPLTDGMLVAPEVDALADWLFALVDDAATRAAIARRTVAGAVAHLLTLMPSIISAGQAQLETRDRLAEAARAPYSRAVERISEAATDGSLMRGEVLARWQEFVGTGEMLKRLETGVGRLRDRVKAAFTGESDAPEQVTEAIESRLASLIINSAQDAARGADGAWRSDPAGYALLGGDDLGRASVEISDRAATAVRGWQDDLIELIRTEGADKRQTARIMAFGVNGTAAALMVAVFSMTGGLTGAEIGIAGGSAVVAQKVLEAVFGEDAVRRMAVRAAASLTERVESLMAAECDRFLIRLAALELDDALPKRLTIDAEAVAAAYRAEWESSPDGFRWTQPVGGEPEGVGGDEAGGGSVSERRRWRRRIRQWWEGQ
ncbi:MAG: ABC transporter [Actinobacteria bacterium]|nr:ABC transporter [Actinomycetota bacterium]